MTCDLNCSKVHSSVFAGLIINTQYLRNCLVVFSKFKDKIKTDVILVERVDNLWDQWISYGDGKTNQAIPAG